MVSWNITNLKGKMIAQIAGWMDGGWIDGWMDGSVDDTVELPSDPPRCGQTPLNERHRLILACV